MTVDATRDDITESDGMLVGPYRRPRNVWNEVRGSIHDDATARDLGFRGGTVPGSVHMEQFPPLLLRAFGQQWFETGGLSCYFRNATVDDEAVRGMVGIPQPNVTDQQVDVRMEKDDGMLVLEGTASVGSPAEPSMLRRKVEEDRRPGELRILAHLAAGKWLPPVPTRLTRELADRRRGVLTEPLSWYDGDSPWGGAIAYPGLMVDAMRAAERGLELRNRAVGLYGAIEVRHLHGPVFIEHDYEASGRVLAVGETPKSELVWYESVLREPQGGREVASMIMMMRFMKASSPLWQDG